MYAGLLVFMGGMAVMAGEMAASRLLAPYFGTSLFVWTNLIGVVMIALTIGYYFGGKLADKHPKIQWLAGLVFMGGLYLTILPFIVKPIMKLSLSAIDSSNVSIFYGSLIASILLIAAPMALLGMVSPLAIRISARKIKTVGKTAGGIYSLGTAGSIVGTFIPALFTIPFIGTQKTFLLFGCLLMVVSIPGLVKKRFGFLLLLLLPLWFISPAIKAEESVILERESLYNYIQVVEHGDTLGLKLNEGHAIHSMYHPGTVLTGSVWDYFSILPLETDANDVLIVGLACGTISRAYSEFYPEIRIDGVEIDPEIIKIGVESFELEQPNLEIHATDGRTYLAYTDKEYDIIIVDAYKQPYIPFHLTTQEFFSLAKNHLRDGGIAAINVGSTTRDSRVLAMIESTMGSVFENVYEISIPDTFNYVVIASDKELFTAESVDAPDVVLSKLWRYAKLTSLPGNSQAVVLTDDKAPVEMLTDLMILDYALQDNE